MRLVAAAVLSLLGMVTIAPVATGSPARPRHPRPFIAYSTNSFLKSRVEGAPVDRALTQQFQQFMATNHQQRHVPYPQIHGVQGSLWGMPFAMSTCADPVWKIGSAFGSAPLRWRQLRTKGFRAPADLGSLLTGTNDSPLVVIDRCDHFTVWASSVSVAGPHVLAVGSFGAFSHASNGLDRRNPASNSRRNFRSRGVIPDSMVIRKDEMHYAVVHHTDLGQVLEFFFVETDGSGHPCFTNPMVGCERLQSGWGTEGTRIAVAPNVNLTTRHCSPQALVIARTLKHYGGYLGDNSGNATALKAQQATPGHPIWHGVLSRNELEGCISWKDFVVIRPGWG